MMSPWYSVAVPMAPFGSGMLGCSEWFRFSVRKRKELAFLKAKKIRLHYSTLTVFGASRVHYKTKPFCSLRAKTAKFSKQKSQDKIK